MGMWHTGCDDEGALREKMAERNREAEEDCTRLRRSELSFVKASRGAEAAALAEADEIFVIGWSVPETDIDQADLIERAVGERRKPLQNLTVVNWNAPATYFD